MRQTYLPAINYLENDPWDTVLSPEAPCAASPATDGERVVVSYGSAGMYCYDFAGKVLWKRDDLGKWNHTYGNASSPVLYGELAILWCGPDARHTRLLAVDKKSGATVWEHKERNGSWSTPLIVQVDGTPNWSNTSNMRQTPTRCPYSRQV